MKLAMITNVAMLYALALPTLANAQATVHYDWLNQGQVAGGLELTSHGDGERSVRFEYNDRGRGPLLHERYRVGASGLIESFRISGRAYLGAPVDERFDFRSGTARWQSTLESGGVESPLVRFYLANEHTPEHMAALARALLAAPGGTLPLWPSGQAGIEALAVEEVEIDGVLHEVSLYAISGLGFGPSYLWLDDQRELFALSRGWSGLTRRGASALLPQLAARQDVAQREAQRRLAADLIHRLPPAVCLSDFAVLDVDAGRLAAGSTVRLGQGRIAAVGPTDSIDCSGLPVVQGAGRTLMPGLWDMHVHLSVGDGPLHLAAGVTSVRDLGNDHDRLTDAIGQFERGAAIGPRVYRAGFIDASGPFAAPAGNLVSTLDDALGYIDQLDRQGYTHIKIYSSIDPAWVAPMAAEMRRRNITLSGHVPSGMSAAEAVRAGFDEIQHINMLFLNFLAGPDDDTRTPLRFTRVAERAAELDLDSPAVTEFIDLLVRHGTAVDPTVSIFDSMFRHRAGQPDPSFAMIADHLPPRVRRSMLAGRMAIDEENAERYAASSDALLRMIARLHHAGVPLVAGTDNLPGFTLHRELELYARAGIPNAEVIRIGTIGAARVVGADDVVGRIAPGHAADLIALDGNPLEDINALRRVALTVTGERMFQPAALHRALGIEPFTAAIAPPRPTERAQAQITAIDTGARTWEPSITPGFPEGAMRKLLKVDQETGIGAALRWHPEGYVEPRHYHTTAAHSIYVLEGRLDVGGVEAGPGHFFHFPAYTAHGPLVALEDVVFLIWSEGPLDFELGDPPSGETAEPVRSASSETSLREAEVIAVAEAYVRALSDRDGAALRALSLPGGSVHAVDLADDGSLWRIRSRSLEDAAVTISEDPDPLFERMWDPIAMVHGPLAMVWTPYDFWVAGEWSHCGVDIFTLVATDDGWKVSSISYTTEISDCPESPLPPPTAEELGVNQ